MCGIFGIATSAGCIPRDILDRGTKALAHRGPDDAGTVVLRDGAAGEIGLGNRRLAILDLSPLAHQPMHDPGTGNWIVYNGEIYNFRDLRRELEQGGAQFTSHSDTEVLLKAYARWGEQCLTRLRGMFAFALWDAARQHLFLARDPMGIKPFYYAQSNPNFIFASEVRAILQSGLIPARLDLVGVLNYLSFGSAYDPFTLAEGIHALPAGHCMVWKCGSIRQWRYWDLVDSESDVGAGASSDVRNSIGHESLDLRTAIEEAVRLQLVSDVPVGVFLSGGIDSSALVGVLARSGIKPSTFSIVFREADFSEAEFSRAVSRKFQTDHHEITVSQRDVLQSIPDAVRAMDLPSMDAVNTFCVSRQARAAGVKVALSGLGGDEVFAGYSNFRTVPRMEQFLRFWKHVPSSARHSFGAAFSAVTHCNDQNRKLAMLVGSNGRLLHPYFLSRTLFAPAQRDQLLSSGSDETLAKASQSQREWLGRSLHLDPINRVSYLESRCYMLNTLLRDTDSMSMSQGLEVRVPLIDHQLAKAVLALPGNHKVSVDTPKPLLVGAVDDLLPDEVVHRPKRGFTLPFEYWLRGELRPEVEDVLTRKIGEGPLSSVLNASAVRTIWNDFLRGATSWTRPWSLFVLQRWCELHF